MDKATVSKRKMGNRWVVLIPKKGKMFTKLCRTREEARIIARQINKGD